MVYNSVVVEVFFLSAGTFLSENHSKMEGNFNGTLHETQKVEEESSSEDKGVAVEVSADDDCDGKAKFIGDTEDVVDIDEHVESCKVVEQTEDASETDFESLDNSLNVSSPNESSDTIEVNQVENKMASETLEVELKDEKGEEDCKSIEDHGVAQTELATSKDNNEGFKVTEVVETDKDMTVAEEENVLPSTDVVSISREVALETSGKGIDDGDAKVVPPKGIEESLVTSTHEKVEEQLDVQESSSYKSAKESFQQSSNVHDSESNSVNEQDMIEESRGIENQGVTNIFIIFYRHFIFMIFELFFHRHFRLCLVSVNCHKVLRYILVLLLSFVTEHFCCDSKATHLLEELLWTL